jgi:isopenicillin N synthase-like dioxygenase
MADGDAIPVIDLSAYLAGENGAVERVAAQVREACLGSGFFYVTGHGVERALVADAFRQNRLFHERPLEEKLRIKLNHWHRGYQPFATSTLASSARFAPARHANQLESFFLRHEVPADTPGYGTKELMGPNQWPDDPAFRDVIRRYDTATRELGLVLLPALSVAVGEAPDFFGRFFAPPSTALRLIHYPAMAADHPPEMLGIQPHTDYGFLTILAQDEVGGLEIRRVDGTWMPAPAVPGSFIINVGDALARWTNDVFNSTPHLVVASAAGRDRYSIGMFFDPNIETEIRCLDAFAGEDGAKYEPIRYGAYFRMRLDANYPDRTQAA